jgi:hypothetical protein
VSTALWDPIDVACDLRGLRRYVLRRYQRLREETVDDLVAGAALELVERGRRHPERRHPRSRLIDFATRTAMTAERGGQGEAPEVFPVDFGEQPLAVPSFVVEAEILAERLSEESTADQLAEWKALSVRERSDRIAEACRLTATSRAR